jgi:hypothetical protein
MRFFRSGGRHFLLWLAAGFMVLGVIFLDMGIKEARQESRYRKEGRNVEAVVLDKWIKKARRGENSRTRYEIAYRFTDAEGRAIDGTDEVDVEEWENVQKGSRINVTHLSGSAEASRTEGSGGWESPIIAMGMGSVFILVGGGIFFPGVFRLLSERRLRRSGVAAEGEVIRVEPSKVTVNRTRQWIIHYRYKDHMGQLRDGKTGSLPPDEARAFDVGDKGEVRFDRHRPQRSIWLGRE